MCKESCHSGVEVYARHHPSDCDAQHCKHKAKRMLDTWAKQVVSQGSGFMRGFMHQIAMHNIISIKRIKLLGMYKASCHSGVMIYARHCASDCDAQHCKHKAKQVIGNVQSKLSFRVSWYMRGIAHQIAVHNIASIERSKLLAMCKASCRSGSSSLRCHQSTVILLHRVAFCEHK